MNLSALLRPCVRLLAAALLGCLATFASGVSAASNSQHSPKAASSLAAKPVLAGDLRVSAAWARATIASVPGAAYFTVTNHGQQADTLLAATSPVAASVTFHRSMQSNGMAHMHAAGELGIAPGQVLKVEPSGLHVMLQGLKQPLAAGTSIPLLLKFRRAGTVTVQVQVIPVSATAPVIP